MTPTTVCDFLAVRANGLFQPYIAIIKELDADSNGREYVWGIADNGAARSQKGNSLSRKKKFMAAGWKLITNTTNQPVEAEIAIFGNLGFRRPHIYCRDIRRRYGIGNQ